MAVLGFTHQLFDFLYIFIVCGLLITGALSLLVKSGMQISIYISRIIVGALFVVSGLIKSNDPLGFSYKLQDYFAPGALDWEMFLGDGPSLTLAIIIAISEVVLGLAILFGGRMRISAIALMGMLLFFSWLTYYTASCNDEQMNVMSMNSELPIDEQIEFDRACVTDCGCFGDALKDSVVGRSLTPWESFKKDAALLVFALIILLSCGKIKFNTAKDDVVILPLALIAIAGFAGGLFKWWLPLYFTIFSVGVYLVIKQMKKSGVGREWITAIAMTIVTAVFTFYTLNYLPVRDFRPYDIGSNFYAAVKGVSDDIDMIYIYSVNGEDQEFSYAAIQDSSITAPWAIEGAEYVDRIDRIIKEGVPPTDISRPGALLNPEHEQYLYVNATDGSFALFQPDSANPDEWYSVAEDISYMRDSINNSDVRYQYYLAGNPGYTFILCLYSIKTANTGHFEAITELANEAQSNGHVFAAVTKQFDGLDDFRHKHQLSFDFYQSDERIIKTMVRSNPGLILLHNGVVVGKWHINSLPNYSEIADQYFSK